MDEDLCGSIDAATLDSTVRQASRESRLPYQHLRVLTREPEPDSPTMRIEASFREPLRLPVPYQILGYNPGSLRASQNVVFREWNLGRLSLEHRDGKKKQEVVLSDVHLFGVRQGTVWVDIDGWIDRMLGGQMDDTRITGLVLFRHEGQRYGMAVGYNRSWQGRSGLLSLAEDKIRFPSPPPLKSAAWKLRHILEALQPSLRPDSLRAAASKS